MVVEASCHCGNVRIEVAEAPESVNECNCSICRRLGALWAYYSPRNVQIHGATDTYVWGDRSLAFHRCKTCGCITHWSPTDPSCDRMGVNARLMPPEILAGARIRHTDGASY